MEDRFSDYVTHLRPHNAFLAIAFNIRPAVDFFKFYFMRLYISSQSLQPKFNKTLADHNILHFLNSCTETVAAEGGEKGYSSLNYDENPMQPATLAPEKTRGAE